MRKSATISILLALLLLPLSIQSAEFQVKIIESDAAVRIQVQCTPWISISEVRLIINGERKLILPVTTDSESVIQFSEEIALTNPIFIDVDGNGQFDAPNQGDIQLKETGKPKVMIQR